MDQTGVGLQSVAKALTDTVAVALDPSDHLAKEQLRLAVGYIEFVRQRFHLLHGRERYDLLHYIVLARKVLELPVADAEAPVAPLRAALGIAERLAQDASASTVDVRAAAMDLAYAFTGVVRAVHENRSAHRTAVDRMVVEATREKLEMERLWYQPVGFDSSPPAGRLEDFLK